MFKCGTVKLLFYISIWRLHVRCKTSTATDMNKLFSGYQACQLVKNANVSETTSVPCGVTGDRGGPWNVDSFNQVTRLIAREDFINWRLHVLQALSVFVLRTLLEITIIYCNNNYIIIDKIILAKAITTQIMSLLLL